MFILMNTISTIISNELYLSGIFGVRRNAKYLQKLGITLIINVAREAYPVRGQWKNLNLPLSDNPGQNIIQYFESIYRVIDKEISSGGKVLVHCMAGISRSATIIISYLMKKFNGRPVETFTYVKKLRPIIAPNAGFLKQLIIYDSMLHKQKY